MLSVQRDDRIAEEYVEKQRYQGRNEDGLSFVRVIDGKVREIAGVP